MSISEFLISGGLTIYIITVISIAFLLILENRNPLKSVSWVIVLLFLPILGLIFYIFFGQSYRKQRLISKKSILQVELVNGYYDSLKQRYNVSEAITQPAILNKSHLISLAYKNDHAIFTTDNQVDVLINGKATFTAILDELEKAKHFIHIEYYIFCDDTIGKRITDILMQKAKQGVEVRMIVDDVGSWHLKKTFFKKLQHSGVEIHKFLSVKYPWLTSKVNYRNHRKIIVIDGLVGFTGGVNISDRYQHGTKRLGAWHDIHMMVKGTAVNGLQSVFVQDWYFVCQQHIKSKAYFPAGHGTGQVQMQVISCGPDSYWRSIEQAFFQAINTAEEYIYLQTPYFMPTESVMMALKTAALSGTDVRLIIPRKADSLTTQMSAHSYVKELLEAGVRVFLFKEGFLHSKMIVSDDNFSILGSANIDFRSFEHNFEVCTLLYDLDVARTLKKIFFDDQKRSVEVKFKQWKKRPSSRKLGESFSRLLSPLL